MNNQATHKRLSKFLSLVLRHQPEAIGIELDSAGWTPISELIQKMNDHGESIDREILQEIVETSDKKRFAISPDGFSIRANQGHSIKIEHGFKATTPPDFLYHGTAEKHLDSIMQGGLQKQNRHHVHLSADKETAKQVGMRHGKPVIFKVLSGKMHQAGIAFYLSDNGVWLTDEVSIEFLHLQ